MLSELSVNVPIDLAQKLEQDGIEELEQIRSLDWLAPSVTVAVNIIGISSNLTTILLAKEKITQFAQRTISWASGRACPEPESVFIIRLDGQGNYGDGTHRSLEVKFSSLDPPSVEEIAALTSFITATFTDHHDRAS